MNRPALQIHLDNILHDARFRYTCPTHVCFFEEDICVLPVSHTKNKHHIFMKLGYVARTSGLTSSQWDRLTDKVFEFIKEKEPCQKQSER